MGWQFKRSLVRTKEHAKRKHDEDPALKLKNLFLLSCVLSCWCDRTRGGASFWLTLGSSEFHRLSVDTGAGSLGGVLARSKPPPIECCSLARWWTGDCLWIPLKRADPVLALSGSGVFVVTGAVDDSDRGF
ncbi:hypothetical protein ACOSQ2_018285 [Xanthoceras sorbifolium]